jgi:hypothetical protein
MTGDNTCASCPLNSNSLEGSTSVTQCKCSVGNYIVTNSSDPLGASCTKYICQEGSFSGLITFKESSDLSLFTNVLVTWVNDSTKCKTDRCIQAPTAVKDRYTATMSLLRLINPSNRKHTVAYWVYLTENPSWTSFLQTEGLKQYTTSGAGMRCIWNNYYALNNYYDLAMVYTNTWNHYAFTSDGGLSWFYLNGVKKSGQLTTSYSAAPVLDMFGLGGYYDDLIIWPDFMSDTQIADLYTNSKNNQINNNACPMICPAGYYCSN